MLCFAGPDFTQEKWCQDYFLCFAALQTADAIRAELTDILKRLELPISEPAFGTKTNTFNVKRALLAGFFMQVDLFFQRTCSTSVYTCPAWQFIKPRFKVKYDFNT